MIFGRYLEPGGAQAPVSRAASAGTSQVVTAPSPIVAKDH
jgi:hypothetical protein